MHKNKSPGSDGLSAEFYTFFWNDLKDLLIGSLNAGYEQSTLSFTQRQAILTLLFKKGNKASLDNWRPISLLNVDYKIAASVLCTRLKRVIEYIISEDQTGFMKKRSAAENVRLVQDIIDYYTSTNQSGIIMFLDFRKAFDNVLNT